MTAMDANWTPIDEDAATGWLFKNFAYDAMGKLKTFTDIDGTTIQKDYLGCGCAGGATVTTTDQRGCTVKSSTDFLGRLSQSSEFKASDVALNGNYNNAVYTYDALDHLTQIEVNDGSWTQAHKQYRTFTYDGYGRTVSETSPEGGTETLTYTANDLLATRTDARGKTVTMTYNTRNLVTGMSYNDSGATPSVSYGYDVFGARTSMTDGEGTMTYHYNSYRQMDYETRTFGGLTGQSFTLNYTYNKADQLTQVNYVTSSGFNKNINYAHNSLGGLTGVGTNLIGSDPNATTNVVSGMTYNGFGATKSLNYGNGRRLTLGYSVNRHETTSMVVDNQNGTDPIINKTYNYTSGTIDPNTGQPVNDNDGRIKKITDSVDTSYTTTYSYDEFNRLTRAQATAYDRLYNYDRFGNLTQVYSSPGVVMQTLNLVQGTGGYSLNNRLANVNGNITYGYDAAGNMTQEGSQVFSYNAAGSLKEAGTGGQNVYGYDGNGQRIRKVENGGAALYYVRSTLLKETALEVNQAQGVYRAYVRVGSQMVAEQSSDGGFYWLHNDHLGSSRKLTNLSGAVVYRGEFDPDGQAILETGTTNLNSHKYTGYERDAATGLDNASARMYSSSRARFTQPDPAGLRAAHLNKPESLNRYSYVENDPVNRRDPSGMFGYIGDEEEEIEEEPDWSGLIALLLGGWGGGPVIFPILPDPVVLVPLIPDAKSDARDAKDAFLKANPGCAGVIDTVLKGLGVGTLEEVFNMTNIVNAPGSADYRKTLQELGFTAGQVGTSLTTTLERYLITQTTLPGGRSGTPVAVTLPQSFTVYLGPGYLDPFGTLGAKILDANNNNMSPAALQAALQASLIGVQMMN